MRKGSFHGIVCILLAVLVAGCATAPKRDKRAKRMFEKFQEKAQDIIAAGGLAAVGIGESRVVNTAMDKAKYRGRQEIAIAIEAKINALQKSFTEEIGEGEGSEYNALFSTAGKLVTSQELRGSHPKALDYEKNANTVTGYALMVLDPKIIANALQDQVNTARHLYTRFRASQAFAELDEEVKKFEEYKRSQGLGIPE
jgi:hypothetical protein